MRTAPFIIMQTVNAKMIDHMNDRIQQPQAVLQLPPQVSVSMQRREDMTSRRSDNLDALITFQGQESQMQATRMALWTK